MGCDIHSMAEVRHGGEWEAVGKVFPYPYARDGEKECTADPITARNYDLFAMLANVRNGWGFAGVVTGEGFQPIAEPRGLPPDVSPEFRARSDDYGPDGHSHGWLTLAELQAYDWHGQTTSKRGVFAEGEYIHFLRSGVRRSWSGSVSGGNVVIVTPDEWEALFDNGWLRKATRDCTKSYYIEDSWKWSYYDSAREFVDETLPALAELGDPADVRIVFFFDN